MKVLLLTAHADSIHGKIVDVDDIDITDGSIVNVATNRVTGLHKVGDAVTDTQKLVPFTLDDVFDQAARSGGMVSVSPVVDGSVASIQTSTDSRLTAVEKSLSDVKTSLATAQSEIDSRIDSVGMQVGVLSKAVLAVVPAPAPVPAPVPAPDVPDTASGTSGF